jgi:CheY-like chemotaxis protein
MPGLDTAAARAIAFEANQLSRAAILAVTADVLTETRRAAGIDAVLAKPMTPDALRRALADLPTT